MNVTINESEGLKRHIEISLSLDELQPHFQKALQAAQAEAQLDGFRKGKVPMNIIKARFGKAIERDALGDVADESFKNAVKEHNIEIAGMPILRDMKRTDDSGAYFKIEYEVYPTITLGEYHEVEIEKALRTINDEDVDDELRNIRLRTSKLEPAEQVADTMHVVKLKFSEIDKETNMPLLGGKEREVFLENENVNPILRNDLLNLKQGDSFRYAEEHAAGEHGDAHAHVHDYHVTVTDIQKVVLPELTADYISQISSGNFSTEEELRADIKRSLQEYWDREVREGLREQIVAKMVESHSFDVPESLIAMTAQEMVEDMKKRYGNDPYVQRAKDEELFQMTLPNAEQNVRWQLIADAIMRKEDLQVQEEDIEKVAESAGVEKEHVRVAMDSNPQLKNRILTDRLFDFLLERVVISERPYNELMAEVEAAEENSEEEKEA